MRFRSRQQIVTVKHESSDSRLAPRSMTISEEVLDASLSVLGLSSRAAYALLNNGFGTVGDVLAKTEIELSRLPRVGRRTIAEVKAQLRVRGLALRSGGALLPKKP